MFMFTCVYIDAYIISEYMSVCSYTCTTIDIAISCFYASVCLRIISVSIPVPLYLCTVLVSISMPMSSCI